MIRDAWTLFPDSPESLCLDSQCAYDIHPFPFSEQGLARSSFNWLIGYYASQFITCFLLLAMSTKLKRFFLVVLVIAACELAEMRLNYNEAWTHILGIPVDVTTLRYPLLFFYSIHYFISWNR